MKKKASKRTRLVELTPELLSQFDQDALVGLIMKLYEQNKQLSEQLQSILHDKYGRKTENRENPNQLRLPSLDEQSPTKPEDSQPASESKEPPTRKKQPGHPRNPMPSHLERDVIERQPSDCERVCACGHQRTKVHQVVRTKRYEFIPATIRVEVLVDTVWECSSCHDKIVIESDTPEPIPNGKCGPRLLVHIAEERWLGHSPYYRQEQKFARHGVDIKRNTMCGWMDSLASKLRSIYDCMHAELLKSEIIATDDTPVKVQDREKKSNIKRGHEWIFMGDNEHPVNLFHYTTGRSRAGPRDFLPGFKGFLQGDCFSGNRALCAESGATFVACRVHDRRYYKKARPNNKVLCDEMLNMYEELFEIESTARELALTPDQVVLLRQQEAVPILNKMKAWLDKYVLVALPSSSFGKAIAYSLNNWDALNKYLVNGNLRIDNNLAEQQMKMFATGRKNWYFFGSDEAGLQASVMLSLFSTCLRNGIEPGEYLHDVLLRLTQNPDCDKRELMPHLWRPQRTVAEIEDVKDTPKVDFATA